MPLDGCEPIPTISIEPSMPVWPTIATTLDVPISSATNILSLVTLAMALRSLGSGLRCRLLPLHGHAVGIAQVHPRQAPAVTRQHAVIQLDKATQLAREILTINDEHQAVIQFGARGQARIHIKARNFLARRCQH